MSRARWVSGLGFFFVFEATKYTCILHSFGHVVELGSPRLELPTLISCIVLRPCVLLVAMGRAIDVGSLRSWRNEPTSIAQKSIAFATANVKRCDHIQLYPVYFIYMYDTK